MQTLPRFQSPTSNSPWLLATCLLTVMGCATPSHPCTQGMWNKENEKDVLESSFVRRCFQKTFTTQTGQSRTLNHGKYFGWDKEERIRVQGQYYHGKKHGKWDYTFSDQPGSYPHYFNQGVEVPEAKLVPSESTLPKNPDFF